MAGMLLCHRARWIFSNGGTRGYICTHVSTQLHRIPRQEFHEESIFRPKPLSVAVLEIWREILADEIIKQIYEEHLYLSAKLNRRRRVARCIGEE